MSPPTGEERMRVTWVTAQGNGQGNGREGEVYFDLLSVAGGHGFMGRLAFPFNRGMQVCGVVGVP